MRTLLLLLLLLSPGAVFSAEKVTATMDPDGVQRVTVTGGNYFFKPDRIVVKLGVPVELTVKKEPGLTPHNFVMKEKEAGMEFEASISAKGGVIKFTPAKEGEFPFYCNKRFLFLQSHRDRGMEGVIEVVP